MGPDQPTALELGLRIVDIIDTGSRESTYKLATLLAICQHSTEHFLDDSGSGLPVSILDLADRVIALYWRQREPYSAQRGIPLRQVKDGTPAILSRIDELRLQTASKYGAPNLWRAKQLAGYETARARIAQVLAQMPLAHLQRTDRGRTHLAFLYDDSALHKKITRAELDALGWSITLKPNVAAGLVRISPLVAPLIEGAWVAETRRLNSELRTDSAVEQYLFGLSRSSLAVLHDPLVHMQSNRCFYCSAPMEGVHIDHVLPWARTGLDDLTNLVASDERCNLLKSASIPTARWVGSALGRDGLEDVGRELDWPVDGSRTRRAARALIATSPDGIRLWDGPGRLARLDSATRREAMQTLAS